MNLKWYLPLAVGELIVFRFAAGLATTAAVYDQFWWGVVLSTIAILMVAAILIQVSSLVRRVREAEA